MLAAVVTYFPGPYLAGHLAALRGQVDDVVVIDNGSPNFAGIEAAAREAGCRVIGNGANLGVAAALNQAARLAIDEGFDWLATFDQDSLIPPGAIAGLLDVHAGHPDRERIAIVAMSHRDRNTGRDYHVRFDIISEAPHWRNVRTAITSGSLVRVAILKTVGLFDEALFIDSVDHDFCMRCRSRGLLVIESRDQVLEHAIGEGTVDKVLWREVTSAHHSPTRHYYITRNTLEMCRRNLLSDPTWAVNQAYLLGVRFVTMLFLENERRGKVAATLQGAWHVVIRRFGPREPR